MNTIKCEICGFEALRLVHHLRLEHGLSSSEYKGRIGARPEGMIEHNKERAKKNREEKQRKIEKYKEIILEKYTQDDITSFYEEGYSPIILLKGGLGIPFDTRVEQENKIMILALKSISPYTEEHFRKHLRMPVWWRNKWDWGLSDEEAKVRAYKMSAAGAKTTQQLRRDSGRYIKQFTIEYWIDQGYSHEIAVERLVEYKKKRTPRNISFWINRGYSEAEAQAKVAETCSHGGVAACKLLRSKFKSKLEDSIAEMLNELEISYKRHFHIKDVKKTYVYDFLIGENKILEVNGTYWHADPRVYSATDINKTVKKTALQIWEADAEKRIAAEKNDKKVLVLWEMDVVKSTREQTKEHLRNLCNS